MTGWAFVKRCPLCRDRVELLAPGRHALAVGRCAEGHRVCASHVPGGLGRRGRRIVYVWTGDRLPGLD